MTAAHHCRLYRVHWAIAHLRVNLSCMRSESVKATGPWNPCRDVLDCKGGVRYVDDILAMQRLRTEGKVVHKERARQRRVDDELGHFLRCFRVRVVFVGNPNVVNGAHNDCRCQPNEKPSPRVQYPNTTIVHKTGPKRTTGRV